MPCSRVRTRPSAPPCCEFRRCRIAPHGRSGRLPGERNDSGIPPMTAQPELMKRAKARLVERPLDRSDNPRRTHRLPGTLSVKLVDGKVLEQWQFELSSAGRIWYCPDGDDRSYGSPASAFDIRTRRNRSVAGTGVGRASSFGGCTQCSDLPSTGRLGRRYGQKLRGRAILGRIEAHLRR